MERLSYLLRHGFDPTCCDNADNYFHPSDPLGPGPSSFGHQHQCHPRPLRPVPADPFEAFRFFNRLHGINERECTERNAYEYLSRPRPKVAIQKEKQRLQKRKVKVEKPDIIELFHGDELPNLYFYNTLHEIQKHKPYLKWFFGFEIIPGEPPKDSIILPPSSLASQACTVEILSPSESPITSLVQEEVLPEIDEVRQICEHETQFQEVSDVDSFSPIQEFENDFGISSDTQCVARISSYRSGRLSITRRIISSMKGFLRLGVSLLKRDMEIALQPKLCDLSIVVTQYVLTSRTLCVKRAAH
uniref:Uncharacterized protein n=1 Tax=Osugoroshi virus TaxID=2202814 RepID=A0A7R7YCC6_9VIRU|nr:hypothetical protein [Osugoroshi virus]